MSSHPTETSTFGEWCEAYDALLAENQRLREALMRIKREAGNAGFVCSAVAREALAGGGE